MPCDTVSIAAVEWTAQTNVDLLLAAMRAMELSPGMVGDVVHFTGGEYHTGTHQMVVRNLNRYRAEQTIADIKKAYSAEVLKSQARKYRWNLKEVGPYEYEVVKR